MKYSLSLILTVLTITSIYSQYTDVINSNRPGSSHGAFSVGKNVLQFELGGNFTDLSHKNLNFSYIKELELKYTIRYGLLMEKLVLVNILPCNKHPQAVQLTKFESISPFLNSQVEQIDILFLANSFCRSVGLILILNASKILGIFSSISINS